MSGRWLILALLCAGCVDHRPPSSAGGAPSDALVSRLAEDPDDLEARLGLAEARRAAGDLEGALLESYKASSSHPESPRPWLLRARIYFDRGLTGREIAAYREALARDPALSEAREDLAHALVADGALEEAAVEYRKVISERPDAKQAVYNLALIESDAGHTAEARALWTRYLELDPRGTWAERARAALAALKPEDPK